MEPTLKENAPRARCYRCGAIDISSLCHHCGKPMCAQHTPAVTGPDGKPLSKEFSGFGLANEQAGAYHCEEHSHIVKGGLKWFVVAGLVVAVLGIIVAISSLVPGLVLLLVGAGLTAWSYRANERRKAEARAAQPALPVVPNLDWVSVKETLHGKIRLADNSEYTSPPGPVTGEVEVGMTLVRSDRDRLEDYRRNYGLAAGIPVGFSAGFAVFRGEQGLTLDVSADSGATLLPGQAGIWFHGDTAQHPLFSPDGGRPIDQWTARFPYKLQDSRKPKNIPIWLVPSLVPASDQRTLEIDVHWVALGENQRQLALSRFEQIDLVVPKSWGHVERVTPGDAIISDPGDETDWTVQWKKLRPDTDQYGRQSITLAIRFEEQIKLVDVLRGQIQASFEGTLSGVEDVAFYQPLGAEWQKVPRASAKIERKALRASVKTEICADFELSLNSIRYQDVRVVPDRIKDITKRNDALALADDPKPGDVLSPDGRVYRPEDEEFVGVIPDHQTVIELTNYMSELGYYIKRVTENQPGGSGRANLVNRVWDIVGRLYGGVFPVDFHITLAGEEEYQGGVWANAGNTSARISVRGSYVNAEMERKIEGIWDVLHDQVKAKLDQRLASAPAGARPAAQPASTPAPESARPSRVDDRVTLLRQRIDSLTDALVAGTVSEATYRELKSEAQAEIDRMQAESDRG